MKTYKQFINEQETKPVYWHGSPSGDLRGGTSGLHLGTKQAATEALTARIGHPAKGEWDGTREYGKTKLAGKNTMKAKGIFPTGHNCRAPDHDYLPHEHPEGFPKMGASVSVKPEHKPEIHPYHLVGKMTNSPRNPHDDFKANGYMKASLKKGNAKNGYFYKNDGEDEGSLSIVVPGPGHVKRVE